MLITTKMAKLTCTVRKGAYLHCLQLWFPHQANLSASMPYCKLYPTNCREGGGSVSVKLLQMCRHHRQAVANAHHVWSTRSVSLQGGKKELRGEAIQRHLGLGYTVGDINSPTRINTRHSCFHFQSSCTHVGELSQFKLSLPRTLNIFQTVTAPVGAKHL